MIVPNIKILRSNYGYLAAILSISLLTACASNKKVAENRRSKPTYHKRERSQPRTDNYRSNVPNETTAPVEKVIATARSFTGVPYRWGGTTRAGMDCSGLLMTCFQAAELNLPRTTSEQVKVGKGVRLYDLQPGDLVFFAAKKSNPNKVTHVGMVTEVRDKHDVRFIHASTKLGVVENNIYTDYYRRIFIKARRPF